MSEVLELLGLLVVLALVFVCAGLPSGGGVRVLQKPSGPPPPATTPPPRRT